MSSSAKPMPESGQGSAGRGAQAKSHVSQADLVRGAMFRSPAPLVEIGVNLTDRSYEKDRADVIQRAADANVVSMIVTGTSIQTSKLARKLCDEFSPSPASASVPPSQHASTSASVGFAPDGSQHGGHHQHHLHQAYPLFFTAGVHPHHAKTCNASTLDELRALLAHPRCVAVGECGLDFNRNFSPPDVQEVWFDKQVALAKQLRKPLFMHCRDAGAKFSEILRRHMPLTAPAVIHCFTGDKAELAEFLELGLHIGITGWICDERPERGGRELAALLPSIPLDRLMIETDAPYITPRTITPSKARPGRNEPALLPHVLRAAAASLGMREEDLAASSTAVARKVFGLTGF